MSTSRISGGAHVAVIFALTSISVIPFGNVLPIFGYNIPLQITDVNIGLLLILGVTSMGVYGVALAGWSSNNKYSLLGGLRASAQMVSYEIALGLSLVGVLIQSGSFSLRDIVNAQGGRFLGVIPRWNIFHGQLIGFFIYLMAAYAETNRIPFDLPEAETELVAGYHTEYSSMKFAMFFMAEYANMITVACVATLLFFGGWHGPLFGPPLLQALLPIFWFLAKVFCFLFLYIWVRGTLPRFRYDQLMSSAGNFYCRWRLRILSRPQLQWLGNFMVHSSYFWRFGAICVGGAVNLLAQRHPINSACL